MDFSLESLKKWKYDVFLSFRGEDTRNSFTGHLYEALCQKGVYTFIDNEELKRGQRISPALEKAIEDSRISVVVLSKTFAFSSSCLDEVLKILEVKDSKGQLVLPVFYDVDPSEVRHQKGSFQEGLVKHEDKLGDTKKMKKWRASLHHVASLSGWHLSNGHESTFIKRIVEEILSKLNRTPLNVAKHPLGLESPLLDMESLLGTPSEKDVRIVGIHGIGGIGKTTIAKALYNHISHQFEASTFIANVREISKQKFGLVQLQEALLSEILNYKDLKVCNIARGMNLIKNRLCSKRVFIVLDDVDSMEQLDSLVGENSWLASGSKVVITTRDEHLLIARNVEAVYKVKELSYDHALELFSWYAFKKPYTPTNYEKLSSHILNYSKGLPLALTVLGSYLYGRSIAEWKSAIHKLKDTPSKQISEVLKISFDGLEENEKAIFLDIACFFKGEDKEYVKKILEACDLYPDIGIGVLVEKSLVTVNMSKLWMHDLVQEMGKEIVLSESPKDPCKRSRLWSYQDVIQVLMEHKESNSIEGIRLDMPEAEKLKISGKAFEKMKKLRILMVDNANFSGGIPYLSNELRLINWPRYPSSTLPPNFHPKRLVSVKINHSPIKHLWKGVKESNFEVIFPSSKGPDWFDHQSTNGLISLEVASRFNGKPVELLYGAVFEVDKASNNTLGSGTSSCILRMAINDNQIFAGERNLGSMETSHLWLMKAKFGPMWPMVWPFNHDMRYWNQLAVLFGVSQASPKVKVNAVLKWCGFHILCKQDGHFIDHAIVKNKV